MATVERKPAAPTGVAKHAAPKAKVAVPATPSEVERRPPREPVWLVRVVLVLFLVGFAAFLAREVYNFLQTF